MIKGIFKKSILTKLVFSLVCLTLIPLLILGLVSYYISAGVLATELKDSTGRMMEKLAANIDMNFMQLTMMSNSLAKDSDICIGIESLIGNNGNKAVTEMIEKKLYDSALTVNFPMQLFLIDRSGILYSAQSIDKSRADEVSARISHENWYRKMIKFDNSLLWIGSLKNYDGINGGDTVCYLARNIINGDAYIGTLIIGIKDYTVFKQLNNLKISDKSHIIMVDGSRNVIFESEDSYPRQISISIKGLAGVFKSNYGSYSDSMNGGKYILNFRSLASFGWRIVEITPEDSVYSKLYFIRNIMAGLIITSVILILFSMLFLKRSIINPIVFLSKLMMKVKNGSMDVRSNENRSDEIGILNDGFNSMIDEINILIDKIKIDERTKRELEFKVLQAQIKPHFLYNILNSIKLMAEIKGQKNIVRTVTTLVKMMEYNLDNRSVLVKLQAELDYLDNYICLSNLRHANSIDIVLDIEKGLQDMPILKLTLQPIVENSVIHGFYGKPGKGIITIGVHRTGEGMTITVGDNGTGMDEVTLNSIFSPGAKPQRSNEPGGIGLKNVNERIKIEFGDKYGLTIASTPGEGTTVGMLLPVIDDNFSEDDEYEAAYS